MTAPKWPPWPDGPGTGWSGTGSGSTRAWGLPPGGCPGRRPTRLKPRPSGDLCRSRGSPRCGATCWPWASLCGTAASSPFSPTAPLVREPVQAELERWRALDLGALLAAAGRRPGGRGCAAAPGSAAPGRLVLAGPAHRTAAAAGIRRALAQGRLAQPRRRPPSPDAVADAAGRRGGAGPFGAGLLAALRAPLGPRGTGRAADPPAPQRLRAAAGISAWRRASWRP